MVVCALECSVCQGTFDTRKEWLNHLLQPYHQFKARKEICCWGKPERDCALIAYSSLPIASLELLLFLSKGSMDLVTDFVWFGNRPKVAIIQFESKQKIEEILSKYGVPGIRVNNQLVEIKKAGECLNMEWQELVPTPSDQLLQNPIKQEPESAPAAPLDSVQQTTSTSTLNLTTVYEASTISTNTSQENDAKANAYLIPGELTAKPEPPQFFSTQYHLIRQEIEISNEKFNTAQKFLGTLHSHVAQRFPCCQLVWFRNWYLKLKSSSSTDELTFFIDQKGLYGNLKTDTEASSHEFPAIPTDKIVQMFSTIPHISKLEPTSHLRRNFLCCTNNLKFSIVTVPFMVLPEIQACRLVEYYCSFDPRVKPLLTVIRYWAKINKIRLENPNEMSYKRAPEPALLDWLVLFFLCHKMKILPSPREITDRSKPKLNFLNVNIGITTDPVYAKKYWDRYKEPDGESHFLNVFNLAEKFFRFYSKQLNIDNERKVVVNIMDGEVIPIKYFFRETHVLNTYTKLSVPERLLTTKICNEGRFAGGFILFLHPLYLPYGFSFSCDNFIKFVCPAMKNTVLKLEQAMFLYKGKNKFDMKSILNVKDFNLKFKSKYV